MFRGSIALLLAALAVGLLLMRMPGNWAGERLSQLTGLGQSGDVSQAKLKPEEDGSVSAEFVSSSPPVVSTAPSTETPPPATVEVVQPQPILSLPQINEAGAAAAAGTNLEANASIAIDLFGVDMVETTQQDVDEMLILGPDFNIPEYIPDEGRGADSARSPGTLPEPHPIVYGVNFISSAEEPADDQRYANGKSTGATWNRFPFYWHYIEETENNFNYSRHDQLVIDDVRHGLIDNAILMGIPGFYFTDGRAVPNSLYQPIFSDGTDVPGPGKSINQNNRWAKYVFTTVNRYRPGGVLAQQRGWTGLEGIRQWELWNEPDLPWFWDGSKNEYARLLKVGYFAVMQADPQAQIIFGSMANNFNDIHYYEDVLTILRDDPTPPRAQDYGYFHHILATHSYYYPWQSWYHVFRAKNTMGKFGIPDHGVWLNETGMSAWDDYPGPIWDRGSWYRGTMTEQAGYTIQTAMYALYAGADAIFHFQLYDACGNQPQGNDFPPHNGNLCTGDGKLINNQNHFCSGDANGLFRNGRDAVCFRQHPNPETPRDNFKAYQTVTEYLQDIVPLKRYSVCTHNTPDDGQEWIGFYRPNTNQRIMGLWSCDNQARTAAIPAVDTGALLISADGSKRFIAPAADGKYYINLPGATNQNYPNPNNDFWPVPGAPFMLIERDLEKPYAEIYAESKNNSVWVGWFGDDGMGAGIQNFDVKVSVDGGPQQNWLNRTTEVGKEWTGTYRSSVEFTIFARDYGGNTSPARSVLLGTKPPTNQPTPTPNPQPTATPQPGATPTPSPTATPQPPSTDPNITVTVDRDTTFINDKTQYQIRIVNTGNRALSSLTVRNEMPWQTDYVAGSAWASLEPNALNVTNDTLTWFGTLGPNETLTLGFRAVTLYTNGPETTAFNKTTISYAGSAPTVITTTTTVREGDGEGGGDGGGTVPPTGLDFDVYIPIIQR